MAVIVENKLHFLGKNLGSLRFIKNVGIQHEINIYRRNWFKVGLVALFTLLLVHLGTEWSMPTDDWEWMKRPTAPAVENTPFEMSLTVQEAPHGKFHPHSRFAAVFATTPN